MGASQHETIVEPIGKREQRVVKHQEQGVGLGEWKWKRVKFQDAEEGVNGGHWNMDEQLDVLSFHVVGDFDLDQIRQMGDEQPHLVAEGPVGDGIEDVFYCLWQEAVHVGSL